ncbi:MAG: hypothetical protein WD708_00495 [Kiritimatiellia bacterium]
MDTAAHMILCSPRGTNRDSSRKLGFFVRGVLRIRHPPTNWADRAKLERNFKDVEADQELQDLILTTHHCFMHTFANTPAIKIIENQNGNSVISMEQPRIS